MAEPVTLAEAKAQVRMTDDDSEDTFLSSMIAPARAYVEKVSTYSFVAGTRTYTFGSWGDYLEIFVRPITSLTSVIYGSDDTELTDFIAPVGRFPYRIYPDVSFPDLIDGETVTVELETGALDSDSVEYLIGKRAMLVLIAHWFEYREAAVTGAVSSAVEFTVKELLDTIRPVSAY